MSTSMGGYKGFSGGSTASGTASGLGGTGYKQASIQQFTPEQMQLFQSLFSHLSPEGDLSRLAGGDQSQFEQLEAPALRQFGELQGQLGSRFSGMGLGGRKGSGFQNALGSQSRQFAEGLQSQRLGLQRQALQDLMGMSNQLLGQRPQENFLVQKQKPWWQEMLMGASESGQDFAKLLPMLLAL